MDTLTRSHTEIFSASAEKSHTGFSLSGFLAVLETNRFAVVPMLLVAMACLGGIAAAFAVQESEVQLMAVAVSTAFIEILVIALAPIRMVVLASAIAFLIDLLVFIF